MSEIEQAAAAVNADVTDAKADVAAVESKVETYVGEIDAELHALWTDGHQAVVSAFSALVARIHALEEKLGMAKAPIATVVVVKAAVTPDSVTPTGGLATQTPPPGSATGRIGPGAT